MYYNNVKCCYIPNFVDHQQCFITFLKLCNKLYCEAKNTVLYCLLFNCCVSSLQEMSPFKYRHRLNDSSF